MTMHIQNLHVSVGEKEILKGLTLTIQAGEIVALMGPNGSGKSTLASTLMGKENYVITKGSITYKGKDLTLLKPEERSQAGIFLSFQHPTEIPGLATETYLKAIYEQKTGEKISPFKFIKILYEHLEKLSIKKEFITRNLNQGFSGGEKKQMEILQMSLLSPTLAILDETDSGLDIDALRNIATGVSKLKNEHMSILIITHYKRILNYLKPDRVIIMKDGTIVEEGDISLADKLEEKGYY